MRLKVGDPVIVIAGNEKGKEGKVLGIKGDRILVQGINKRKKHQKPRDEKKGGTIVEMEMPMHISNVMFAAEGKGRKIRVKFGDDNAKQLYYKTENGDEKIVRTL